MANLRMLEAAAAHKVRYYENDELLSIIAIDYDLHNLHIK